MYRVGVLCTSQEIFESETTSGYIAIQLELNYIALFPGSLPPHPKRPCTHYMHIHIINYFDYLVHMSKIIDKRSKTTNLNDGSPILS